MKYLTLLFLLLHGSVMAGVVLVDESPAKKKATDVVARSEVRSATPNDKKGVETFAVTATAEANKVWEVRISDGTIYGTLKRWTRDAGMELVWETDNNDMRLGAKATYTKSFDEAVFELMKSVEHAPYPMRACIYENNAVRVIHSKKSCRG